MNGKKVLIIDDDVDFLRLLRVIFEDAGALAVTARDGLEGMGKLFTQRPDLILLDVMMPDIDGFIVCRKIRQFSSTPLILISMMDEDELILRGLEAGADEFLSKPINPEILLARARALTRRGRQTRVEQEAVSYKDSHLEVDIEKHRVRVNGVAVKLTSVEFRLLAYLIGKAGRVLSFEQILFSVWGSEYKGNDDYVHVYVSHLRSKIEPDPKNPRYIRSIYGVGYIFERQEFAAEFHSIEKEMFVSSEKV